MNITLAKYIAVFLIICGAIYLTTSWFNGVKTASYNAGYAKCEQNYEEQREENRKKVESLMNELKEIRGSQKTIVETKIQTVREVVEKEKFVVPQLTTDQQLTDVYRKQFEDISK